MTIQIATTLEQSKRLLEAGVPGESADLWWRIYRPMTMTNKFAYIPAGPEESALSFSPCNNTILPGLRNVPAWSMARLWGIVRENMLTLEYDTADTPSKVIESLVYMICRLSRQGRLKIPDTH